MASDDAELEAELTWERPDTDPDSGEDRRPPGTSLMLALTALLTMGALGAYLEVRGPVLLEGGVGSLVDFVLFLAVSAVVANWLSRWIWRHLGARLRTALRPLGRLGPAPPVVLLLVLSAVAAVWASAAQESMTTGKDLAETIRGGPLEGADFVIRADGAGRLVKTSLDEATAFCRARGPGWRLPHTGDEALLTSRVTVKQILDGEELAGELEASAGPFAWSPTSRRFQRTLPATAGGSGHPATRFVVVCVK